MIGYWHEVRIPGSIVDELLGMARFHLRKIGGLIELLDAEAADRKGGKQAGQWADVSAWIKKVIESPGREDDSTDPTREFERRLLACFDDRSLAALNNAVRKGEFELSRSGPMIRLKLTLTRRDAQGLAGVLRQIDASMINLEENDANLPESARLVFLLRAAIEATARLSADENGIAIEVDSVALLNRIFSAAREIQAKAFAADARAKVDATAMTKEVKDWRGGGIEKGIDAKALQAGFNARKLEETPAK